MFDTFFGLPTHAVIVHAVVVFVPLTAIAAVALTAVPRWRTRFGVLAGLASVTSIGSVFVAQESGEILEDWVLSAPDAPFELVLAHTALGENLLSLVYVIRIGHSGSEAVWSDLPG